jgi:hypothetical protein
MSLPTHVEMGAPDAVGVRPRIQFEDRPPLRPQLESHRGAEIDRTRMGSGHREEKQLWTLPAVDCRELETQFGDISEHVAHDPRVICLVDDHQLTCSDLVLERANGSSDCREVDLEPFNSSLQWIVSIRVSGHVASSRSAV